MYLSPANRKMKVTGRRGFRCHRSLTFPSAWSQPWVAVFLMMYQYWWGIHVAEKEEYGSSQDSSFLWSLTVITITCSIFFKALKDTQKSIIRLWPESASCAIFVSDIVRIVFIKSNNNFWLNQRCVIWGSPYIPSLKNQQSGWWIYKYQREN